MIPTKTGDLQRVYPGAAENGVAFPIVGVGASAGGLAATTDLLRHLGPRPGLAVVVLHHLDPSHESSLVDLFSRVTPLPVAAVTDRTPVESNHVYVVPPNTGLGIAGGLLDLTPRLETGGLHLPIDRFLESLARDRTDRAIGVVLTGTGADGAIGIQAIKAEGGITFAQDASAEYRSMPESAIGTGCVDFILPPDAIARELTRIGARAQLRSSPVEVDGDLDDEEGDLRRIQRRVVVNRLEEIVSSNEEHRSTNQEMRTVNDEMAVRSAQATRLNDDLSNVLSSVDIPIVLLGRDGRIRRFTPAASRFFHVIASDIGRPISDIRQSIPSSELTAMIAEVLEHLGAVTRTVKDDDGRWHDLTVRPYVTADNRIDGTVVTAFNVDASKKAEELLSTAYRYSESVLDTVHVGLLVLDGELRVRSANRTFRRLFALSDQEIVGRHLDEVARGEWNSPALKQRLQDLGEQDRIEGYRVELESGGERRVFALNGRRIEQTPQILLALEEVTDKERAERALQRTESGFRQMLTTIAEAILMTDGAGRIVFANELAGKMFGYATEELIGLSVDALVPERMRGRHTQDRSEFMAAPSTRRMGRGVPPLGRRKDGGEFPLEVVLGSMQQEGGPLVMSFITDISARLEAERKLRDYRDRLQHMAFDAALAEERERRRIAADLHDRIGQSLALAQITLTSVRETISGAPRVAIDQAVDLLAQSATDTRTLIFDLSPPILHDLGFKAALSWLAEDLQKRHRLEVMVSDDGADDALDDASATLLFRAVRELLLNVFKHAQTASARVSMHQRNHLFQIEVEDRGIGFDANDIGAPSGAGGFGLFSVREQIGRLGGNMQVTSVPLEGTRIRITVPTRSKSAGDAPSSAHRPKETQ